MSATTKQFIHFERQLSKIKGAMEELDLVPVGDLARKWGTTKEYVRRNVPIVKLGPKTHRVRLEDAVAFQQRRTQQL